MVVRVAIGHLSRVIPRLYAFVWLQPLVRSALHLSPGRKGKGPLWGGVVAGGQEHEEVQNAYTGAGIHCSTSLVLRVMNGSVLLGAKAEMVMGFLLLVRHRSVRLAGVLAAAVVLLSVVSKTGRTSGEHLVDTMLVLTGTLAAVAGSRLLAPGGALAASRQAAAHCWMAPLGRLAGAFILVLPVVCIVAFSLCTAEHNPLRLTLVTALYAGAVASGVMALAPAIGATAASAAAFVVVWVGAVPASDLRALLESWPLLHRAIVGTWNVLPLHWRAVQLLDTGNAVDGLILIGWVVFGVAAASWVSQPVWPVMRRIGAGF